MKTKEVTKTVNKQNKNRESSQMQIFENNEFGSIRTLEIDGEPWFVGKDIAVILGYSNPRDALAKHVDDEDKGVAKCDTPGGVQDLTVINESGLYSLVLSSKLSTAKKFKRWVTSEVIPSIRKHGVYMTPETIEKVLYNPDFIIQIAKNLKSEQEKNKILVAQNEELQLENEELTIKNEALSGKIQSWDYKALIRKLINIYSAKIVNGYWGVGWVRYYDELFYKYGINLKSRQTKSKTKKSCLDFISEDEIGIAIETAVSMCEDSNIETADILRKFR